MKRKYTPTSQNPWVLIIGIILMLSILFTIFSNRKQQGTLDVYTKTDKVKTDDGTEDKDKKLDVETTIYTDNENHFSLEIPADWDKVTKDGFTTFIHSASASSLQIQVSEYDPRINNVTADTISTEVAGKGMTFTDFTRHDNASYQLMYQDFKNSTYDYIEEVYWDRDTTIKLVCTFNDKNYEKIIPYFELILNSFAWNRESEIPEGYYLYYSESPSFEVGIPDTWTVGAASNAIVATDSESGATQTITLLETDAYLDSITATDMAKLLNSGKNGFMMSSYENAKEQATVKCTYTANNIQFQEEVYAFANGKYICFVAFDYEIGTIDEKLPGTCAGLFRSFDETNTETQNDDTNNEQAENNQQ